MVFFLGKQVSGKKKVIEDLLGTFGLGRSEVKKILALFGLSLTTTFEELNPILLADLERFCYQAAYTAKNFKRMYSNAIVREQNVGSYKGRRFVLGLPVRGQNTKTNARTAKKKYHFLG